MMNYIVRIVSVRKLRMRNYQFPDWKAGILRTGKEIEELRGGVRTYAAQARPKIDAARAEKHPCRTKTRIVCALLLVSVANGLCFAATKAIVSAPDVTSKELSREKSVLEGFRAYNGQRTPSALMSLFKLNEQGASQQHPLVALSDGVTPLALTVKVDTSDGRAPNFACNGGEFLSAKREGKDEWRIEMIPAAGSMNSSILILAGGAVREMPLKVAPPLPPGTDLSPTAFVSFLSGGDSTVMQSRDLNGDNLNDYQDDYIFTANFLVKQSSDPHNPATRLQKARELTPKR